MKPEDVKLLKKLLHQLAVEDLVEDATLSNHPCSVAIEYITELEKKLEKTNEKLRKEA